jgi:hypothetical protein
VWIHTHLHWLAFLIFFFFFRVLFNRTIIKCLSSCLLSVFVETVTKGVLFNEGVANNRHMVSKENHKES